MSSAGFGTCSRPRAYSCGQRTGRRRASARRRTERLAYGLDQDPFGNNFVFYHVNRVNVPRTGAGRQWILTSAYGWRSVLSAGSRRELPAGAEFGVEGGGHEPFEAAAEEDLPGHVIQVDPDEVELRRVPPRRRACGPGFRAAVPPAPAESRRSAPPAATSQAGESAGGAPYAARCRPG